MAKEKIAEVFKFVAQQRRSEVNGHVYEIGEETNLEGLSDAEIGHVVGRGYYGILEADLITDEQWAEIEKELG